MLNLGFSNKALDQLKNTTIIALFDTTRKALRMKSLKGEVLGKIKIHMEALDYKGKIGETLFFRGLEYNNQESILVIGTGALKTSEDYKRLGAHVLKAAKGTRSKNFIFPLENFGAEKSHDHLSAFYEGMYLTDYSVDKWKSKKKDDKKKDDLRFEFSGHISIAKKAHDYAKTLSECINFARHLGDLPGNLLTPPEFAKKTQAEAKNTKLKVTVWDRSRIKKENMGCFLGVSLGGVGGGPDPRLIIMEYNGGGKSKRPACFVGKGLTFDTGGISIKPAAGMHEMKYDMCGGANVVGTMLAIAKLRLKVNAIGIVPSTENMPGPLANKPGDILTARNGKTVEVNNTDAEGRLILADALVYASEQKPAFICDIATLTGAMTIALGNSHTGFYAKNDAFAKRVESAAKKCGESVWRMPVTDDHLDDMKGTYADLTNVGSTKFAGSAQAAAFLAEFVDLKIPWAHFDIAGTAWYTGNRLPYNPSKGASGVMIKTFIELAK